MDRKAILILLISFVVLLVWFPLTNRLFPPVPVPKSTNLAAQATNLVALDTNRPAAAPMVQPPTLTAVAALTASFLRPDAPEQVLAIESAEARYTFTSHGGGLKVVELKEYPETVGCGRKRAAAKNKLATVNGPTFVPALTLLDGAAIQGDGQFQLTHMANGVHAEKTLTNGLRLVKEFQIGTNHLLSVAVRLENRSDQPVKLPVQEWVIGTATPLDRHDDGRLMGVMWFDGAKAQDITETFFGNRTMGCIPGTPHSEYLGGASNVVWAAVHNQFFALAAIPSGPAPRLIARRLDLPPPTEQERQADSRLVAKPFAYQTALLYPEATLAPNEAVERRFDLFAGPKEYNTLARHASHMKNNLDQVMGFGGFFGFCAKPLLLSMNGLHGALSLPYGWAIIVITIIIKIVFWPLTNASTKSMKRMAALQPQMKTLQEKYKGDPKKMNEKLMEFMKEHKVNPMGGCLPMLLQIPVFFGFYTMLQSAIELRGAQFLWACDLSKPDTIFVIPGLGFIPFFGIAGLGLPLNPLPLLMGVTMLWQARLTPPSPGMDPVQQKIMKYMPLMFLVFLYNFSAGLTLYWTVQNLLTIAQMKLTKAKDPAAPAPKSPAPAGPPKKKK